MESDSDSEEHDEDKLKDLEEKKDKIIKTLYPTLNLRRVGDLDRKLVLRKTRETLSFTSKIKGSATEDAKTDNKGKRKLSEENVPGTSETVTMTQEDISPLLPNMLPRRMVNLKINFDEEDEESEKNDEDTITPPLPPPPPVPGGGGGGIKLPPPPDGGGAGIKTEHVGIIDSSIPLKESAAMEDLNMFKKFQGIQFIVKTDIEVVMKDVNVTDKKKYSEKSDTPQKSVKTDSKGLSVAPVMQTKRKESNKDNEKQHLITTESREVSVPKKVETKSKEEGSNITQESVKTDSKALSVAPTKQIKRKESDKDDEKQHLITTKSKEVSVTKKVETKSKEKSDITQKSVKTESKELGGIKKVQTKSKEEKKSVTTQKSVKTDTKGLSVSAKMQTEKVYTRIPEKIETKSKQLSLLQKTSPKKYIVKKDTKSIKSQTVSIKVGKIKYDEVLHVVKTVEKLKLAEEMGTRGIDITKGTVIELVLLVTSTMESLLNCLIQEEKINRKVKEACKCREKREMLTEKRNTKNWGNINTNDAVKTFYTKIINYVDKGIQHVMYLIIFAGFPNKHYLHLEEIKIK